MITIDNVLDKAETSALVSYIDGHRESFADGAGTAGWSAREVKKNEQLASDAAATVSEKVRQSLMAHPVFVAAGRPKSFVRILVSRYSKGMKYGTHIDDALIGGLRTDLSFTLFLSEPDSYDGGVLTIESNDGDTEIKLPAGSAIIYPSTHLHRVTKVTRGERLAVVGWIRSFIRGQEERDILFDLDNALATIRREKDAQDGVDRLLKVKHNLLRRWCED